MPLRRTSSRVDRARSTAIVRACLPTCVSRIGRRIRRFGLEASRVSTASAEVDRGYRPAGRHECVAHPGGPGMQPQRRPRCGALWHPQDGALSKLAPRPRRRSGTKEVCSRRRSASPPLGGLPCPGFLTSFLSFPEWSSRTRVLAPVLRPEAACATRTLLASCCASLNPWMSRCSSREG